MYQFQQENENSEKNFAVFPEACDFGKNRKKMAGFMKQNVAICNVI